MYFSHALAEQVVTQAQCYWGGAGEKRTLPPQSPTADNLRAAKRRRKIQKASRRRNRH